MIQIYDTMTKNLRPFEPLIANNVSMYVCGPTVYNYIHLGNARSIIAFDTVRRYFEYRGYDVNFVSNFTDIDDKIIAKANNENQSIKQITDKYIEAFYQDCQALNIKPAQNPKVTEFIPQIIQFIQDLLDKDVAYITNDGVYFSVEKDPTYGTLSHKCLDELKTGASERLGDNLEKKNSLDFVLWKFVKKSEPYWTSPWGNGRPGWHIECSVMATEILGNTIDIHGGGADLEFPHHTNEIAQSEAKTGQTFANNWMHNGFVNIDNKKMSKSLNNFITVHDALKTIDGQVLRFLFATQHYRKPINFSEKDVKDAVKNINYLRNAYKQPFSHVSDDKSQSFVDKFIDVMDKDFNTANGISVVYEFAKWINSGNYSEKIKEVFADMLDVFGIVFTDEPLDENIEQLIQKREVARKNKDFTTADQIRNELKELGILLEDTKTGVRWTKRG